MTFSTECWERPSSHSTMVPVIKTHPWMSYMRSSLIFFFLQFSSINSIKKFMFSWMRQ